MTTLVYDGYVSLDPAQLVERQTFLEQLIGSVSEVVDVIRSDVDLVVQCELQSSLDRIVAVEEQVYVIINGEINRVAALVSLIRGQIASEIESLLAQALSYQALGMGDLGLVSGVLGQFFCPPSVVPVLPGQTVVPVVPAVPVALPEPAPSAPVCPPVSEPIVLPAPVFVAPPALCPRCKCEISVDVAKGTITVTDDGGDNRITGLGFGPQAGPSLPDEDKDLLPDSRELYPNLAQTMTALLAVVRIG